MRWLGSQQKLNDAVLRRPRSIGRVAKLRNDYSLLQGEAGDVMHVHTKLVKERKRVHVLLSEHRAR